MSSTQESVKLNVLLVDDESEVRLLIKEIIESELPVNIIEASSGVEAWDIFQKQKIDFVVTDIQMPGGMTGLQLTEKITKKNSSVPVILLTAHNDSERILHALKLGASDYLLKPITGEYLVERIQEVIEKRHYFLMKQKMIDTLHSVLNISSETSFYELKNNERVKHLQNLLKHIDLHPHFSRSISET